MLETHGEIDETPLKNYAKKNEFEKKNFKNFLLFKLK